MLSAQLALHLKQAASARSVSAFAPLSGMQPTPLASHWRRFAGIVWRFGGQLFRDYVFKSKFQPRWSRATCAASGSVGVFFTLADLSLLAGRSRAS